ncbi:hypothetical protein [Streptomyces parvus]|uniref:hypothetical protein n=1 Tax=Streptomyces parvus TaxID=66428 RepID=UPI00363F639D
MRRLRSEMITLFAGLGWTQERIARLTGMSRPAVSKQVAKARPDGPASPPDITLDQHDTPWLEGRPWDLAEEISASPHDSAHCTRSPMPSTGAGSGSRHRTSTHCDVSSRRT